VEREDSNRLQPRQDVTYLISDGEFESLLEGLIVAVDEKPDNELQRPWLDQGRARERR
jgi:hypothetical protein